MDPRISDGRYRFEGLLLDARERHLERAGQEIHLRPKSLDTLIYLVERQGHLVTKQELLASLWPDAEVTENALTQCIRDLREALSDDQKNPRFIQTVQRAGYRFIAEVEQAEAVETWERVEAGDRGAPAFDEEVTAVSVLVAEDDGAETGPLATVQFEPESAAPPADPAPWWRRRWRMVAAIAALPLVAGAVALGSRLMQRAPGLAFVERDWILIADFENHTGEPVFDAALRAGLERELGVSRYVNFVPPGRVIDTLQLMKRPPDTRVTEQVGHEICLRDGGIRAMVAGSIQLVGGTFAIVLKLVDPVTGGTVAVFDRRAPRAAGVLDAIQRLSADVRGALGESLTDGPPAGPPLERVTTTSLEALALYSRGLALMDQFEWARARTLFDEATTRDPAFASAYHFRGLSLWLLGKDGAPDFKRAAALAGQVTLREKLRIDALADYPDGDATRPIDRFESFLDHYPDDYWGHELVSWLYLYGENPVRWREHQAACRRLRPNFAQPHFHAGWVGLLVDGDAEKAQAEFDRVLALKSDFSSPVVQCGRGFLAWMQGRTTDAANEVAEFRSRRMLYLTADTQVTARHYLSRFYQFQGKPDEALAMLETNRDMTQAVPSAELATVFRFPRALVYQELGRTGEFERLMTEDAARSRGMHRVEALGWLAISAARRGETARAAALRRELVAENGEPPPSFWSPRLPVQLERAKQAFGLQIDGESLLAANRTDEALRRFQAVLDLVPPRNALFYTMLTPRVWLAAAQSSARAHEQRGDWAAAAANYESILKRKILCLGTDGASGIWIDALRSIGGALEKAGRGAEAARYREEYGRLRPS